MISHVLIFYFIIQVTLLIYIIIYFLFKLILCINSLCLFINTIDLLSFILYHSHNLNFLIKPSINSQCFNSIYISYIFSIVYSNRNIIKPLKNLNTILINLILHLQSKHFVFSLFFIFFFKYIHFIKNFRKNHF